MLKKIEDNIKFWVIASMTMGLAPFTPEPHVWGKLKWVMGGAVGMKPIDWGDFVMHGAPWLLLIIASILKLRTYLSAKKKVA
jgi:hypothetical protein